MQLLNFPDPLPLKSCTICTAAAKLLICSSCASLIPKQRRCLKCGIIHDTTCCARCNHRTRPVDEVYIGIDYLPPFDAMIQGFKYGNDLPSGKALTYLLLQNIPKTLAIDTLIPIPLHAKRLMERGFNQAEAIAADLARTTGWTLNTELLTREKNTPSQTNLNVRARIKNMHRAFKADTLTGLHIGLVDDVFTTGATLLSAAKTLKKAGAAKVTALVLAKTTERN